jgi:tRNA G18 (ribose-2'-O)-methylase SpoU
MRKLKLQELNRLTITEYKDSQKLPIVVVLDNIRSGLNIGSFFRTGDAFRIDKIYLTGITATPPHREITKTAIGATESVDWEYADDVAMCIKQLKDHGYEIYGIEQTDSSIPLSQIELTKTDKPVALVFGNEVNGLTDSILPLIDTSVEIEQFGTKHSLNVSVCAGICMWQFAKLFHKG